MKPLHSSTLRFPLHARADLCLLAVLLAGTALPACGGSAPTAESAPAKEANADSPAPAAPAADQATAPPQQSAGPAAPAEPAAPEAAASDTPTEKSEPDPDNRQRQVLYRTTPQGMAVSIEGVEIRAKAEAIKLKNGGFGILLKLEAEAKDGSMHTLLSPKDGPLAIGGTIKRKRGEPVQLKSERSGEDDQFITADSPLKWEYSWPPTEGPFAWYGDEIELQVGLWGLGNAGERRRPVRKLFIVKMVATQGAKPVVMAPRI